MKSSIETLIQKATTCIEEKKYKRAVIILNEIIETENVSKESLVKAYFLLANTFHIQGEIAKAIKAFKKVLNYDPAHTDASISLSVIYNDIGYYDEAKKVFDVANERVRGKSGQGVQDNHINKKFADKHFELAELYLTYNRFDEALFEYNKVIALDPDFLDAKVKIAKVYAKKGFLNKAVEELRRLKNECPSYLPAKIALGVLYYGQGHILEAQAEWQNVLSREPQHKEAAMYINLSKTATETKIV